MEKSISKEQKLAYLESMIQFYEKNHEKKFFIEQYLRGAGNELCGKFWKLRSSSRMAYDLYSWMSKEPDVIDFEFEYKLPNLKSGGMGPNMDVFIETEDELIFVESKFTERADLHYIDNDYLKKAYYEKKGYGRNRMMLIDRFYGNDWANLFSEFCSEWEEKMKKEGWHKGIDWFEPKQETCHLSGILLFLFDNKNHQKIKGKKIRLYNIYWKMENDNNSPMQLSFCENAQKLIDKIINKYFQKLGVFDFKLDAFSVQEMLNDNTKLSPHIKFPSDLKDIITKRNDAVLKEEGITCR